MDKKSEENVVAQCGCDVRTEPMGRGHAALTTITLLLCWGCAAPNRPSQPPAAHRAKVEAAPRTQARAVSQPKAAPAVAAKAVREVPALGLRVEPVTGIDQYRDGSVNLK